MLNPVRNGATVLVADDNEGIRELLSAILSEEGYQVVTVKDGEQALNKLRRKQFDLALLDVMMPRRTGFAVCRAVKMAPETCLLPVILITGLRSHEDRIQGIESGADDFLNKPVNKEELLARVRSLVRIKHFTDELESAETVLLSLALSIEAKDPSTQGHCERDPGWVSCKLGWKEPVPDQLATVAQSARGDSKVLDSSRRAAASGS